MDMRRINLGLLAVLLLVPSAGCQKPESDAQGVTGAADAETVARIHWLGKKQLTRETNAAYFMGIWNLPESSRLAEQTLDKLSVAPWRFWKGESAVTNAPRTLLRPLLEDLVQEESYLEVSHTRNQPGELALAIRLTDERAALWRTNLAAALESLTGLRTSPPLAGHVGWSLKKHDPPNQVELARVGDWTLVAAGHNTNALLRDMMLRIQRNGAPFGPRTTNYWLEASLDLRRVSEALGLNWQLPKVWPQISLVAIGDGENVRTRGELSFAEPLALELEPWNIPTNLVHDPLVSFTAIRGIRPWLASLAVWNDLQLGRPPNQLFTWSQDGMPFMTYAAAWMPEARQQVGRFRDYVMHRVPPWLTTNGIGKLESSQISDGIYWRDLPFLTPHIEVETSNGSSFVTGGFALSARTNRPPPPDLLKEVLLRDDLIFYQWEITDSRMAGWTYIGQTLRLATQKPQLPAKSAGIAWLEASAPKQGNCVTVATQTPSGNVAFSRRSSFGFTALESHLIIDWLESPQFPRGLHTFLAPRESLLRKLPKSGDIPKSP